MRYQLAKLNNTGIKKADNRFVWVQDKSPVFMEVIPLTRDGEHGSGECEFFDDNLILNIYSYFSTNLMFVGKNAVELYGIFTEDPSLIKWDDFVTGEKAVSEEFLPPQEIS